MSARTLLHGLTAVAVATAVSLVPAVTAGASPTTAATHTIASRVSPQLPPPRIVGAACSSDDGITVVVDFRNLSNRQGKRMNVVRIGCAEQPVGNGFDALLGAGFKVDPDNPFVCTIDNRPLNPESCPEPDGFWAYNHGVRGDRTWDPSGVGAGDWNPPPGSLEGWSWWPYEGHDSWGHPRVSPRDLFPPRAG